MSDLLAAKVHFLRTPRPPSGCLEHRCCSPGHATGNERELWQTVQESANNKAHTVWSLTPCSLLQPGVMPRSHTTSLPPLPNPRASEMGTIFFPSVPPWWVWPEWSETLNLTVVMTTAGIYCLLSTRPLTHIPLPSLTEAISSLSFQRNQFNF